MERIQESGVVARCEPGTVWVRTIQRSACASCQARHGCGQSSLQEWMSDADLIALPAPEDPVEPGQTVQLSIAANALAKAALLIYLMPLVSMLLGLLLAHMTSFGDGAAAGLAFAGFGLGCFAVKRAAYRLQADAQYLPRVENPS